jgi:hypothetical protein
MRPAAQSTSYAHPSHEQRRISITRTCPCRSLGAMGPCSKQLSTPVLSFSTLSYFFHPLSSDVPTMQRQSKQEYQSLPPEQARMPSKSLRIHHLAHMEYHQAPPTALTLWTHQATSSERAFTGHSLLLHRSVLLLLPLLLQQKPSNSSNSNSNSNRQRQHPRASRRIRLIRT